MDQTTYFSFSCPACAGRARVASHHAGQAIVCPYCQVNAVARPDIQPSVVPRAPSQQRVDAHGNPLTTSRVARPLGVAGTASIRRQAPAAATGTQSLDAQELFTDERTSPTSTRSAAPGMSGFADNRPVTASVRRVQPGTATVSRAHAQGLGQAQGQAQGQAGGQTGRHLPPQPGTATITRAQVVAQSGTATISRPAPGRPPAAPAASQAPFFLAAAAAASFALLTTWAAVDANTYRTRYQQVREQADKATTQLTEVQATADTLEKRLAKTQMELAAAQAAVARGRELVADLHKTVGRLGEDLAKAALVEMPGISTVPTSMAVNSLTAGGTFPSAALPMAGVPVARREKSAAPAVRAK